jgi:hypothetical protein
MSDIAYNDNPAQARPEAAPTRRDAARDWMRIGAWSGLIAALLFMGGALIPMPDRLAIVMILVFPLPLLVAHVGLYRFLSRERASMWNQLAVILGICAPVLVSAMLTVQQSMIAYMQRYYHPLDEATRQAQINIWRAVDSVQLGLDVAWDMFILPAMILFSLGVMRDTAFPRWFGFTGLVLGVGGLFLNIWTFPTPPINVGLPDVGPFAMTWYAILFVLLIRAVRKLG